MAAHRYRLVVLEPNPASLATVRALAASEDFHVCAAETLEAPRERVAESTDLALVDLQASALLSATVAARALDVEQL